jgi:anti-sigma regulatory factor (Ser/Thr protein kinase)
LPASFAGLPDLAIDVWVFGSGALVCPSGRSPGDGGVRMEKRFNRGLASLNEIFEFTESFFSNEKIDEQHQYAINFSIEELFTNMVKYNDGEHDILLDIVRVDNQVKMQLTDFDVDPFDVTMSPEVSVDAPIEEREPGGLGLHLVGKLIDRIEYEYVDRKSRVTLTKTLG